MTGFAVEEAKRKGAIGGEAVRLDKLLPRVGFYRREIGREMRSVVHRMMGRRR
jgi:hypothetical protein